MKNNTQRKDYKEQEMEWNKKKDNKTNLKDTKLIQPQYTDLKIQHKFLNFNYSK